MPKWGRMQSAGSAAAGSEGAAAGHASPVLLRATAGSAHVLRGRHVYVLQGPLLYGRALRLWRDQMPSGDAYWRCLMEMPTGDA